jgi:hypothetical protein
MPCERAHRDLIEGRADLKEVTASQETVRRILRGIVIPTDWNRVNAVFQVFCEIGEIDPDADRWEDSYNGEESNREYVRRLWDAALEEEPNPSPIPPHPEPTLAASDSPATHGRKTRRVLARATNRRSRPPAGLFSQPQGGGTATVPLPQKMTHFLG